MKSQRGIPFITRLCLALLIVGGIYGFVFLLPSVLRRGDSIVSPELTSLRASLNENYLILNSLVDFSGSDAAAAEALVRLHEDLKQSGEDLQQLTNTSSALLEPELLEDTKTILTWQQAALKDSELRYSALSKPILYDPSADLGSLNLGSQTKETTDRAQAASQALSKLTLEKPDEPFELSPETRRVLSASANCFANLAKQLEAGDIQIATATHGRCVTDYTTTRRQAVQSVTTVFRDDSARTMMELAAKVIKRLDEKLLAL